MKWKTYTIVFWLIINNSNSISISSTQYAFRVQFQYEWKAKIYSDIPWTMGLWWWWWWWRIDILSFGLFVRWLIGRGFRRIESGNEYQIDWRCNANFMLFVMSPSSVPIGILSVEKLKYPSAVILCFISINVFDFLSLSFFGYRGHLRP